MHWIDATLLVLVGVCAFFGALSGLVWQVARVGILVVSVYGSMYLQAPVSSRLEGLVGSAAVAGIIAYLSIFVCCYTVLFLVTWWIERALKETGLKKMDRLLGAGMGAVKGLLLGGLLLVVMTFFPFPAAEEAVAASTTAPYLIRGLRFVMVAVPEEYRVKGDEFLRRVETIRAERSSG